MSFDLSAFTDTTTTIRRHLAAIDAAVAWFAPHAYEQRRGGHGEAVVCSDCNGKGTLASGAPCDACVVAVIGDAGEIVLRRRHIVGYLERLERDAERIRQVSKGMVAVVADLAKAIDHNASPDERIGPITVDHREVAAAWEAKRRRVAVGEPAALPGVEADARRALAAHRRQQEAVRQASAAKDKAGNRWRK
jgi:hypothetical protein